MTSYDKTRIQNEFAEFLKELEAEGLPSIRFEVGHIPAAIVIDDRRPEKIVVTAHLPSVRKTYIGHVFATGKDASFQIHDIYVEPNFRENEIGSKLLEGTIAAIEKFKPILIKGSFKIVEDAFPIMKRLFEKFGFTVSQEPDNQVSVFRDYSTN